jgi:lipopolysaccharide/colanic/teichoic acid biosynthesis glycosyltransferase
MALQDHSSINRDGAATALSHDVSRFLLPQWSRRLCDIVAASLGLVLLSPILLITALAIKLGSRGPIFIDETLVRADNQRIKVLRFRLVENTRPTAVGRVLAHSGIDELPRLIDVLRGDLSIVGRQNVPRWSNVRSGVGLRRRG